MTAASSVPRIGARVVRLATVDSTQRIAFDLAADGAPDGTVVVADEQRAGRGRRGRVWRAAPGEGLLLSILLRPRLAPHLWPTLSLTAAVAVAEALDGAAALAVRLKWPNDVMSRGRKLAGILLESRPSTEPVVVVGIGLNVGQREFPADLAGLATSVAIETGRPADRDRLLGALLGSFEAWQARLEREGFAPVRERWLALTDTLGRRVTADAVTGEALDLDDDGALVVRADGRLHRVVAGEVADAPRP